MKSQAAGRFSTEAMAKTSCATFALLLSLRPVAALVTSSPPVFGRSIEAGNDSSLEISTQLQLHQQPHQPHHHHQQQQQPQLPMMNPISSGELLLVGLLISLILVSIVGNCLVCVAIFTDRRLRKLGNAFIVSLAIADLFVSCLVMTFALCNDLMNYWIFGDWFCDVWISFDIMCCTASILNLCAISLDRFIHIKDCLLYNQWMTRRAAISAVIIIWFISALVSFVPINLGWHKPDHQFMMAASHHSQIRLPSSFHEQKQLQPLERLQLMAAAGGNDDVNMAATSHIVATPALAAEGSQAKLDYPGSGSSLDRDPQQQGAMEPIENQSSQQNAGDEQLEIGSSSTKRMSRSIWQDGKQLLTANSGGGGQRKRRTASRPEDAEDFVSPAGSSSGSGDDDGQSSSLSQAADGVADSGTVLAPLEAQFNQVESNPQDGSQIGKLNSTTTSNRKLLDSGDEDYEGSNRAHLTSSSSSLLASRNNARWPASARTSLASSAQHQQQQQQLDYLQQEGQESLQVALGELSSSSPLPEASSQQQQQQQPNTGSNTNQQQPQQCMLTLTPTYAIISSTISFYIPCIIMLGLYTKLFACARKHVRNIQAISKAPAPIAISRSNDHHQQQQPLPPSTATTFTNAAPLLETTRRSAPIRTWLKLAAPKLIKPNAPNAQTQNDKSIKKAQHNNNNATTTTTDTNGNNSKRNGNTSSNSNRSSIHRLGRKLLSRNSSPSLTTDPPQSASDTSRSQQGANDPPPLPASIAADNYPNKLQQQQRQIDQIRAGDDDQAADETVVTLSTNDHKPAGADNLIMTVEARPEQQQHLLQSILPAQIQQQQPDEQRPFLDHQQQANSVAGGGGGGFGRSKSCRNQHGGTKTNAKVNFQGPTNQQSGQLATHKAAVTLGIIMGTFLFCWVPFFCLNIIKAFCVDCIPSSLFRAFTWLGYANSALNPIIYGIHNSEFRNAFNRIFFKHLNIKNSRYYQNRRFSYDQRHPAAVANRHRQQQQQQNCHHHNVNRTAAAGSNNISQNQTLKWDAAVT